MNSEDLTIHSWNLSPLPSAVTAWPVTVGRLFSADGFLRAREPGAVTVHFLARGSGVLRTFAGEFPVQAGDMLSLWPGVYHHYEGNAREPWEIYWTRLGDAGAAALARDWGFSPEHPVHRPQAPDDVARAFQRLFEYWGRESRYPYRGLALFYRLIAESAVQQSLATSSRSAVELVTEAEHLVEDLLETGINISELARRLGVSRSGLWNAFKEAQGVSPVNWLQQIRIQHARQLLRETTLKMAVIARLCGFRGEKYFLRKFREAVGITPGQYRRSE